MRSTNKSIVREILERNQWSRIGEAEWKILHTAIPGLTTSDLKHVPVPVEPPWQGVRQQTLEELENCLRGFSEIYAGRSDLRRFSRDEVIRAKDHARLASRNRRLSEESRALKSEMVEWMLVWLADPAMFPAWVEIRTQKLGTKGACSR